MSKCSTINMGQDIETSTCYNCKTETKKFSWDMGLKKESINKRAAHDSLQQSSARQSSQRQSSARANSEQQLVKKIIRPRKMSGIIVMVNLIVFVIKKVNDDYL